MQMDEESFNLFVGLNKIIMQDDVAYDNAMKEERGNKNQSELLLLYQRINKLNEVLEKVLVQHVASSELRDFYRMQAGT